MAAVSGWQHLAMQEAANTGFASADAEASVIACFFISANTLKYVDELTVDDFTQDHHRKIFLAIRHLKEAKKPVDLVTVDDVLAERHKAEEPMLMQTCIECTRILPTSANVKAYVDIVRQLSYRRRALSAIGEIYRDLQDGENETAAIVEKARQSLRDMSMTTHKWTSMSEMMLETYGFLEKRVKGELKMISSGLPNVDSAIGGFFAGELTIIGARPSVGKSAFGANIALCAAMQGFKVGICSREMTSVQYGQRVISYASDVDGMKLRKAELEEKDWESIVDILGPCADLPISFLFTVRTVEELRAEVQAKVDRGEIDLLVVDYLQLMRTTQRFKEDHLRVAYISKTLKDMTTDLGIPIIALAQVKRFAGGGRSRMPTLEDLKDSGALEQDADGVIFIHRPDDEEDPYVDPRDREYFGRYKAMGYQYIAFGIAKQRQGATGKACALFNPAHMRYIAIDRDREAE